MNKRIRVRISQRFVTIAALIALTATIAVSQYNESTQISSVQNQVRLRVLNDNRGSNESVIFDNNATVIPPGSGRVNRIAGSGRYRSSQTGWRVFNYEGQFNTRTGAVSNVMYSWSTDGDGGRPPVGNGKITWGGRVDATARLTIQGGRVVAREIATRVPISEVTSNVAQALPRRAVNVTVSKRDGRGPVSVLQQPSAFNNFTAIIEISDPGSGSDYYSLDIDWDNDGGNRPSFPGPGGQGNRQMYWEGSVDDVIEISIQGNNARYDVISGRLPTGVRADFDGRLPRRAVEVSVRKVEGRGDVEVVQQPERFNNFTAKVRITDRRGGADRYVFELDWDRNAVDEDNGGSDRQLRWEGNVDDVIEISVQGRNASYRVISGRNPTGVRADFDGRLPRREMEVAVRKIEGRGDVEIVMQPEVYNNYTAVIRITDRRGGADRYVFELDWDRNAVDEDTGGGNAKLDWSGRVDDVVRLEIQGRNVRSYAMSGQPLSNVRFNFSEALPRRAVNVTVDRRDGRGDVRVIQQPNRSNNFTAIIEVRDTRGGADNYSLDVNW
jgi:hypothetical protein